MNWGSVIGEKCDRLTVVISTEAGVASNEGYRGNESALEDGDGSFCTGGGDKTG